jgi:hypothetical protein
MYEIDIKIKYHYNVLFNIFMQFYSYIDLKYKKKWVVKAPITY